MSKKTKKPVFDDAFYEEMRKKGFKFKSDAEDVFYLLQKYPDAASLTPRAQKKLAYTYSEIKQHNPAQVRKFMKILIKKDFDKESPNFWQSRHKRFYDKKGELTNIMNDADYMFTRLMLEKWNIPEAHYTAIYGSD